MQRTLLALTALVASATVAGAQQQQSRSPSLASPASTAAPAATGSTTSIGPVLGLDYTTFTGSDASGAKYRTDLYAGGLADFTLGVNGMFRTGLVYAGRGAKENDVASGTTGSVKLRYLEIPLMLGFRFGTAGTARPYLMGGGNVGFNTGCTLEASQGGVTASIACDDPSVDLKIKSTDFAVSGGGGVAFPVGTSTLDIHAVYAYGLTKLVSDANTKNAGFTFAVAYMIPIGGKR